MRIAILGLVILCVACEAPLSTEEIEDQMRAHGATSQVAQAYGWSQSGKLITGQKGGKVGLAAAFPESGEYTVKIECTPPKTGAMTQALITWITNGNQINRLVTVGFGVTVSGTADSVSVAVTDVTDFTNFPGMTAGNSYDVSIVVAKGNRPATQEPAVLIPGALNTPLNNGAATNFAPGTYLIPPNDSETIPIPITVGVISIFAGALCTDAAPIVIDNSIGQILVLNQAGGFCGVIAPNTGAWVPIPPGAASLSLKNNSNTKDVTFSIAFGVDG